MAKETYSYGKRDLIHIASLFLHATVMLSTVVVSSARTRSWRRGREAEENEEEDQESLFKADAVSEEEGTPSATALPRRRRRRSGGAPA